MKVLVVAAPLLGHVFPLVPLALALREAGHHVVVATGGEALRVSESGLEVAEVTPDVHMGRLGLRTFLTHPLAAKAELAGKADLRFVSHLFGAAGKQMMGGLSALAQQLKPDMIVHEPLAAAGAVVAAQRGIPHVVHDVSMFDGVELTAVVAARMRAKVAEPFAVLRTTPPSIVEHDGWPMRFVPYSGDGPVPDWLREVPTRPRILVSRSTVAGPGGDKMMTAVVGAADQVDAEFVLVRPARRDRLPANVRVVDWVPLPAVLPNCAAVVHHGGAGTVLGALAAGVPQLVEPGVGDRTVHARLVAERGAGLAAKPADVTPELLTRLVGDPAFGLAAKEVRAEIAAMPSPAAVAARLAV